MKANLIIKRGLYYVVITYRDADGLIKKKWFGTGLSEKGNKRRAEEEKTKILANFHIENQTEEENVYIAPEPKRKKEDVILFGDYIEDWLERSKPNLRISSYSSYKQQVEKIAKYFREKKITLSNLKPLDIANYYKHLQDIGKSVQLCEHYHVNIRKSLQTALKAGLIEFNPADRIDRPRSPKNVAKYYDLEQLEVLFKCLVNDRFAYIYETTAYYGLRRSEMIGLKWENIDFKKNIITLKHTVVQTRINGKSIIVKEDKMKNQSSLRSLPLLPVVKQLLLEEKDRQSRNKALYGNSYEIKNKDYVCVDDLGYLINPSTVSSHFKLVLKKNELPVIKFHELRHSCASLLLSFGVSMKEIQEWLGHSTYSTTADIYSHLNFSSKLGVANAINNVFKDTNKSDIEFNKNSNEEHIKKIETLSPAKIRTYNHRENTVTKEFDDGKTPMNLTNGNVDNSSLSKDIEELEKLLAEKKASLLKKSDIEM